MKKVLIIVRGLPGSGKSSLAKLLSRANCCADDWYMRKGVYQWDYRYLQIAHEWCQRKCRRFMEKGVERIVVSNTSLTDKAINIYMDLAKEHGYMVYSIIVENRHGNSSIHDVPLATLLNMESKFVIKLL